MAPQAWDARGQLQPPAPSHSDPQSVSANGPYVTLQACFSSPARQGAPALSRVLLHAIGGKFHVCFRTKQANIPPIRKP